MQPEIAPPEKQTNSDCKKTINIKITCPVELFHSLSKNWTGINNFTGSLFCIAIFNKNVLVLVFQKLTQLKQICKFDTTLKPDPHQISHQTIHRLATPKYLGTTFPACSFVFSPCHQIPWSWVPPNNDHINSNKGEGPSPFYPEPLRVPVDSWWLPCLMIDISQH